MSIAFKILSTTLMEIEGKTVGFESSTSLDNASRVFREINSDEARCIERFGMGKDVELLTFNWSIETSADSLILTNEGEVKLNHKVHSDCFGEMHSAIQTKINQAKGWTRRPS